MPDSRPPVLLFFFFNDTATTEIYTLPLHDALPISHRERRAEQILPPHFCLLTCAFPLTPARRCYNSSRSGQKCRSEEHTSELQSQSNLVCRLLLEKKKIQLRTNVHYTWIRG